MLTVSDFERSVQFYTTKLGFKRGRSLPGRWLELTGSGLSLFLVPSRPGQAMEGHGAAGLTLIVDDVDATKRLLEMRGVSFIGDVVDAETLRLAIFEDPDANPIYLVEQIEDHPTLPLPIIPHPIKSRLLKHFLAF
jgi:catechol 2,3-dioxygenase-like lactoylglutathione lyase family enzyme